MTSNHFFKGMMKYIYFLVLALFIIACGNDENSIRMQLDQYVEENAIDNLDSLVTTVASGESVSLWFVLNNPGEAERPGSDDVVSLTYQGFYVDGEVFDSNSNINFELNDLIDGWQLGLPLIGRNGEITLIIPPNLAYGPNPQNGIRSNALLIFDIELHDF